MKGKKMFLTKSFFFFFTTNIVDLWHWMLYHWKSVTAGGPNSTLVHRRSDPKVSAYTHSH